MVVHYNNFHSKPGTAFLYGMETLLQEKFDIVVYYDYGQPQWWMVKTERANLMNV